MIQAFDKIDFAVQAMVIYMDKQETPETEEDVKAYFALTRRINKSRQPYWAKHKWIDTLRKARGQRFARAKKNKYSGLKLILGGNEFIVRKSKAVLRVI